MTQHQHDSIPTRFLSKSAQLVDGFSAVLGEPSLSQDTLVIRDGLLTSSVQRGSITCVVHGAPQAESVALAMLERYHREGTSFRLDRRINGTFLLLDRDKQFAVVGRDATGVHHLYLSQLRGQLFVSTRIEPFLGTVCTELSPIGCDLYLAYGISITPFPLYQGLHAALPGHCWRLTP
ncbi:MAG: hypothetical protein RBU37_27030, partial [Myxococcota bacterium]|nr:hypothetical protein [Myxococcota bacterium]